MALDDLQNKRYHHLRLLGSGGMGEVYLMEDTRVNRQVAIKVIRSEGASYPDTNPEVEAARLFQREAKAIAALDHPSILPLYDFGEENRESTAITYMVMPYCADGTLEEWLRQRPNRVLPPQDVAYLVEQAAEALQYAHDHNVMHLDVKPSNFLLRIPKKNPERPFLLLADFGIARSFTTVSSSSHTIRGTPTSMAPEQWSSTPVFATDQYALAVTAYELLVGRPPFIGRMEQLMYQHFNAQPLPPSSYNPQLPPAIDAVILRALAKKPEERFPSVVDFASALTQAAQGLSTVPTSDLETIRSNALASFATLSISQAEASSGLSRLITLPGGRQVVVPIPAGAQNGQIIRLPNADDSSGQANTVLLTIVIDEPRSTPASTELVNAAQSPNTPRFGIQPPPDAGSGIDHNLPTVATSASNAASPAQQPPIVERKRKTRVGGIMVISIAVVILLIAGTVFFYVSHLSNNTANINANNLAHSPTVAVKLSPSPTVKVQNGLYIAGTYNGSMYNQTTGQTTFISVFVVQTQGDGTLKGSVTFKSSPQGVYTLNGTDDMQGNFSFTVQQPAGQTPLFFYGTVQQSVNLHGNFCSSSTGPCLSNTGYFTVGPRF
ncbi:MAG: serine/threonine protein kinase [Ktedonobacteraceae bacterium]